MRRRDLERVADPLAGREAGPGVRRPRRRMRTAVHEDGTIERSHELDVIDPHVAGQRILLLEDAGATEAAPLMRRRMRPALILRRPEDRFGGRLRPHHAGGVEGNAGVVTERRLRRRVVLAVVEAPLAGDIRRILRTCGLRVRQRRCEGDDCREDQHPRRGSGVCVHTRLRIIPRRRLKSSMWGKACQPRPAGLTRPAPLSYRRTLPAGTRDGVAPDREVAPCSRCPPPPLNR